MSAASQTEERKYRFRHLGLLISLLGLFVVTPFVVTRHFGVIIVNIIGTAVLLFAAYAISVHRRYFGAVVVLALLSVVCNVALLFLHPLRLVVFAHCCIVVLIALFALGILGYVLRKGRITADKIYAAICVYLLVGYGWSFGYAVLEEVTPGSFSGLTEEQLVDPYVARVMQLRYFSFITLATVGYGDILPKSPAARTLAALEAVMGQFYMAVLVARLVGLHIVHSGEARS